MKALIKGVNDHIFRTPNIPWGKGGVSPEAAEVLAKFPNPLSAGEEAKIIQIVDAMVAEGIYSTTLVKYSYYLTDPVNRLTSWFGTKTATAVNAPTFNLFGVLGNGTTSYIDNNIIPSDLAAARLNDIHIEGYCYENFSTGVVRMFGSGDASVQLNIFQVNVSSDITARVNCLISNNSTYAGQSLFQDKTRYGIRRDSATMQQILVDGVVVDDSNVNSSALPTTSMYSLAFNSNGTPSSHINARQSYYILGFSYDLTSLNTVLDLEQSLFNLD